MSAPNLTEPTLTAPVPPDAWDLFVLRHSKRGNLVIHFVSFLVYYGALIGLAVTWNPWWIVGLFVSGAIHPPRGTPEITPFSCCDGPTAPCR